MRSAPLGEGSLPRPLGTAAGTPSVLHRSDRCLRQRRRVRLPTLVLEERGLASPPGSVHTRGGLWGRSTQRKTAGWWPPGRHCPALTLPACTGALGGRRGEQGTQGNHARRGAGSRLRAFRDVARSVSHPAAATSPALPSFSPSPSAASSLLCVSRSF